MLRIVHPAPSGQGTRPPRRRGPSPSLSLTPEEVRHLRAAIKNTARALGGMPVLAEVTGLAPKSLAQAAYNKRERPSAALALLVARAAGMSVEAVIGGQLTAAGRCQACGSRVADRRAS